MGMFRKNPIYERELWAANRSVPFIAAVCAFHMVIALIALVVFSNMLQYIEMHGQGNYEVMLQLYIVLAMAECLIIVCVMPAMAGAGIAQEKERRTFDLMMVSGISPFQLVAGKQKAYMNTAVVLVLSGFPALSLVFVYGGIQIWDMIWLAAVLLMIAWYLSAIALFCSAVCRKAGYGIVIAYAVVLLLAAGTLVLHYHKTLLLGTTTYGEEIGSRVAWYHYGMLFNPVVTVYVLLHKQAGSTEFLFDLINYQGNYRPNWVTQNWVMLSLAVQLLTACILLGATIRIVGKKG